MREDLQGRTITQAGQLSRACQVSVSVLEYAGRAFLPEMPCAFCARCRLYLDGQCDYHNTHLYGCFEADRWNGLYIYYCPLNLGFIATAVYDRRRAEYAMVTGPIVIGSLADTLSDSMGQMTEVILTLPCRTAEDTTALSRVLWAMCAFLSGRDAAAAEATDTVQAQIHNALYAATAEIKTGEAARYPLELEKRLQRMITQGDREGARELINQLLGQLYFSEDGDFDRIKANTKGLLVLFSRAAIDGGADAQQIFGHLNSNFATIDHFTTLDELSIFLTSMFYRFVGYIFDFTKIKNTDLVHKVLTYVRENYARKITLDEVALHVHLSRTYLSRVLGEALGMSFSDFVNSIRIEKSKELLGFSQLTLAEISDMLGFSDQSYFTKVFHKTVGISPGEYRKRGRQDT